jgi:hypothetical protein
MESENSLPLSQKLATFLRPEPTQSRLLYASPFLNHPFYYYPRSPVSEAFLEQTAKMSDDGKSLEIK